MLAKKRRHGPNAARQRSGQLLINGGVAVGIEFSHVRRVHYIDVAVLARAYGQVPLSAAGIGLHRQQHGSSGTEIGIAIRLRNAIVHLEIIRHR